MGKQPKRKFFQFRLSDEERRWLDKARGRTGLTDFVRGRVFAGMPAPKKAVK